MALTNEDLRLIGQLLDIKIAPVHERLDKLEGQIAGMNDRLGRVEDRLCKVEDRLDKVEGRLDNVENQLGKVNERLDSVENRLGKTEARMGTMEMQQLHITRKLEDLKLDMKFAERNIRREIHALNDEMGTVIEILKMNDLIPQ